jgi:integrase/recombinase XerD
MSTIAPLLEAFFTEGLTAQRRASPNTIAAYRDAWCLLLRYAQARTGKQPSRLALEDLDAPLIGDFLNHLESERGASVRTRNARLTAIRALFNFAAYRHPEHAALIQRVLAIPTKKTSKAVVTYLDDNEIRALLNAPDRSNWIGRRDHALLILAVETGMRVSELTRLTCGDVRLGAGGHVRCHGKGRKERVTPLRRDAQAILRVWLAEQNGAADAPLFPAPKGRLLSRDAVRRLVERHTATATRTCPSLKAKNVTPHTMRHSCAMNLLRHEIDPATIALLLGHEDIRTTYGVYLHADLTLKEKAIARTAPLGTRRGRYRPPDRLLAFLEHL